MWYGGTNNLGAVFRLTRDGKEKVLYSFTGGNDGANPQTDLITDTVGNLYGTASAGGVNNCGVVFKIKPNGHETVLYTFNCRPDGFTPNGALVMDSAGNLYGTTYGGGAPNMGTVFKVAPDGTESIAYAFQGGSDAGYPNSGLIMDKKGNLFGTTYGGGTAALGTVYKLSPKGTETVLYSFKGGSDGADPFASLSAEPPATSTERHGLAAAVAAMAAAAVRSSGSPQTVLRRCCTPSPAGAMASVLMRA